MRSSARFDRRLLGRGILFCGVALSLLVAQANAANLLGYYDFEGNFDDSSGNGNHAAAVQNPGEVSFEALGFRGQSVDINDPAMSGGGNTGGTVNLPIDANPAANPEITFGGWVNLAHNTGFQGFMAVDNGGWDRGITVNSAGSQFGIASGGGPALGGAITVGEWQYVVGTFSKAANAATLYVGDANAANQTTTTGTRTDAAGPGTPDIEIGRYDNQDLDALVDDVFVFEGALDAHQANAIRNLRLSSADLSPADAAAIFDLFDAGAGSAIIGGLGFSHVSGLDASNPGAVVDGGGGSITIVLDDVGNGLSAVIPEPSSLVLGSLALLMSLGLGRLRRRNRI